MPQAYLPQRNHGLEQLIDYLKSRKLQQIMIETSVVGQSVFLVEISGTAGTDRVRFLSTRSYNRK